MTSPFFEYKPDYEEARLHWEAFWNGEMLNRPCTRVLAPKDGSAVPASPPGLVHPDDDLASVLESWDKWAQAVYWGGDAVPFYFPNFGPDIYAAFLGADLHFAKEDGTSWAKPCVTDWRSTALALDSPGGYWWDKALEFSGLIREAGRSRYGAAGWDLHSNLDALAALRGPQDLCTDLVDCPDDVENALNRVRMSYKRIYDDLYEAGGNADTGTSCWLPYYCEGRFSVIQCDFICLISPAQARRFVLPALEEEAAFLDRCCYHLDGPGALIHLEDILAIEGIDSVQWVPGSGNPPVIEWIDLLKKIQQSGKSVYVAASPEQVKVFHRELRPEKVFYDVWAASQAEADALLEWLKSN